MLPLGRLSSRDQRGRIVLSLHQLKAHRHAHQCKHLESILRNGRQGAAIGQGAGHSDTSTRNATTWSESKAHAAVHSAILRCLLESSTDESWLQLTGMSRKLRWTGDGNIGRGWTDHELQTKQDGMKQGRRSVLIDEPSANIARSADIVHVPFFILQNAAGLRKTRYLSLDKERHFLSASSGSVSSTNPLKIGSLVVFGLEHTRSCDDLDSRLRGAMKALAIGMPSPTMPHGSVTSIDSLGLISNVVIQELQAMSFGSRVSTDRNSRGQARISYLTGFRIICCLDTYNTNMRTIEPPPGFEGQNWRRLDEQAQRRYHHLQTIPGLLSASLAPVRAMATAVHRIDQEGRNRPTPPAPSSPMSKRARR
ncbi:BQ2448_2363 [Microbotryum intermedium]|uniref:BQ2448_2363 protein n=1 Tax=Microbotryum intermedium TaxID=269621 RepID=A0A238FBF3_9BASI|nr:BQ2448_2363 [Microbotryum intermedium]